ncbi:MAG: ABC transporter ATP-binding protein, partial [Desulfovibrio sp.]
AEDQLFSPTVLEDVAFGPLNLGLKPAQAKDRALETLEQLGLEGFADRITHRLSGGEKRLVALATILAMQPKALLLDEPTNDLDPPTRQRLIATLNELDLGYVIISHDWDFLAQTTEQSLTLDKDTGRLVKSTAVPHTHVHVHEAGDAPHEHPNGPKGHKH